MKSKLSEDRLTLTRAIPINARLLKPKEIAARFVPPPSVFDRVQSRNHAVIMGPRGSGKTTLLSMLTQPAQRVWVERSGAPPLDYLGVLVRADLTWSRQLRLLSQHTTPEGRRELIQSVYVNHCLLSVVRHLKDYLRHLPSDVLAAAGGRGTIEKEIGERFALVADTPTDAVTFGLIKDALYVRGRDLWRRARDGVGLTPIQNPFDLFSAVSALVDKMADLELLDSIALLLDELELVPQSVRDFLTEGIRDADDRLLLKMSLSPVQSATAGLFHNLPGQGQDFLSVNLAYPNKTRGYRFTESLIVDLANRSGHSAKTSRALLGPSAFDLTPSSRSKTTSYERDGRLVRAFMRLKESDPSFAEYAKNHGLDMEGIERLEESKMAAQVRKLRDIVLIRNRYMQYSGDFKTRLGSKSLSFYSGDQSTLAMLEGNPRWVVNYATSVLPGALPGRRLNGVAQASALAELAASIRSRIATSPVPVDDDLEIDPMRGTRILLLIDSVGNYFREAVLGRAFNADPPLTFTVDAQVDSGTAALVSDAITHGAIIHVPPNGVVTNPFTSVYDERFRLAYLLAAEFQLPPVLGRPVNLSSILRREFAEPGTESAVEEVAPSPGELRLFS